jgi:hypothetical protein
MSRQSPREQLDWLNGDPPLYDLMERYPADWEIVGRELLSTLRDGRAQTLSVYARKAKSESDLWKSRIRGNKGNAGNLASALPHLVRSRMALMALDKCCLAAATGVASGKIRFNLLNGFIIQRLLFARHLTRKPASLGWFRIWWPLVTQKRILMPLVQPKGIYCFYTRALIRELARRIASRSCLEIAAGDGTLARFLSDAGISIRTTDDHSWSHVIQFPANVEKLDAQQALQRYQPEVVVCSWPPPGNGFERLVFATRSVELYIVIGSRYPFASGDWRAYSAQNSFEWSVDHRLSRYVLPPELDSAVLTFRRKS